VEEYLELREQGVGRHRAGELLLEKGVSENYFYFLDKTFKKAVSRAKVIFEGIGDSRLPDIAWIKEVTGKEDHPILDMNQFCLEHGVNAVCFSRITILIFRIKKAGKVVSHNPGSFYEKKVVIDSS